MFNILQFQRSEVQNQSHWIKVCQQNWFVLETLRGESISMPCSASSTAYMSWFIISSSHYSNLFFPLSGLLLLSLILVFLPPF